MYVLCENFSILESMFDFISQEPLVEMCYRIDKRIDDIDSGNFDDLEKSEEENTELYINEIRSMRNEIENNSRNLIDKTSKEKLRFTLNKVTVCLEKMKSKRIELGCGLVNYEDVNDFYKNELLFDLLT